MRITSILFIILGVFGSSLAQIVNHKCIERTSWMDGESEYWIIHFEKDNLYKRYHWNKTRHLTRELDTGKYNVNGDTITCISMIPEQMLIEFVYSKEDGKNVLRSRERSFNVDGSFIEFIIVGRSKVELPKELYKQWRRDLKKN
jgi:hypothetical protein